ncbi:MAG: PLP-dependent aspartate aminotransferase family protein [Pseudomonadota bacterium]
MSDDFLKHLAPETRAVQALRRIDERTGALVPGIEPATTFARDADYEPRQRYVYGRDGGPTVEEAEAVLADLDGAAASLAFASGMAAIVALFETLSQGDHVAAPRVMYHGGQTWLHRLAERRGIAVTWYDAADPGAPAAALKPGETRILWVETPTNPNWEVIDIAAAADATRAAGALLAVDCTATPPTTTRALELGADIAFHSATKYLGGHSDLVGGVLSLSEDSRLEELRGIRSLMGSVLGPFEAWLLIRGIRTLWLRYAAASANALAIAEHFQGHRALEAVLYPGLPSHPGHAIAKRQMTGGFGGMLSLLARDEAAARQIARTTRVFTPATSLGGVESLIEHRKAVEGPYSAVAPNLLRLSVGIEAVEDLIADLERALENSL